MRTGVSIHSTDAPVWLQMVTNDTDFQPWLDLNWWLLSLASFLQEKKNHDSFIHLASFPVNE